MLRRANSFILCLLLSLEPAAAQYGKDKDEDQYTAGSPAGRLTVEGISALPDDPEPRTLYILPWQLPSSGSRSDLDTGSPELVNPLEPEVVRKHLEFRRTLDPYPDSSFLSLQ